MVQVSTVVMGGLSELLCLTSTLSYRAERVLLGQNLATSITESRGDRLK